MKLDELIELQQKNTTILLFFFTASWCGPCKKIKPYVYEKLKTCSYPCYCLDVDDNIDIYKSLKAKKQIQGVPTILAFKAGNISFIPDKCVSGANPSEIDYFFKSLNGIQSIQ
jgi:thiol-disulfide isomerase/thioredoxin